MVVHLSFLVIGSRDQTNAKSAQTVRGPISRGLSLSLSFSPSRVRLGLSTSTPIEVEAYITRAAARGRGRCRRRHHRYIRVVRMVARISERAQIHTAPRAQESRGSYLGRLLSSLFFGERLVRRRTREKEGGRAEGGERASGVVAMRRRRRRNDGEVTEKKTETDGELSAGMRLVDQRKRESRIVGKRPCV